MAGHYRLRAIASGVTITRRVYIKGDTGLLKVLPSRLLIGELPYYLNVAPAEREGHQHIKPVEIMLNLPSSVPLGRFDSAIIVQTSDVPARRIHFRLYGLMTSGVVTMPERVLLTTSDRMRVQCDPDNLFHRRKTMW